MRIGGGYQAVRKSTLARLKAFEGDLFDVFKRETIVEMAVNESDDLV